MARKCCKTGFSFNINSATDNRTNRTDYPKRKSPQVLQSVAKKIKSEYPTEQITALLTALQMRGVTVDELLGFRDGILETGVPAILNADRYVDVVGTGGDRKNTFNISTTACFVIAGAGYKVAKHGNYAATSVSGASNVIQHHGIKFTDDIDKLNRSLNEAGIVYLHAQLFAKAMKFVGPIRKALQFPTIFNLLGPLVNPSQPKCQLLGVANLDQMRLYNQVYQKIGIDFGIVNSGGRGRTDLRQRTREPCPACPEEHRAGQCRLRYPGAGEGREEHRGVHRHCPREHRLRRRPPYV